MRAAPGLSRERGGILITFALMAALFFGIVGMIIDLGQAFNRHAELQAIADIAAVRGAKALNGSAAGITSAVNAARTANYQAQYSIRQMILPDSAISFSASPDAPPAQWKSVSAATAAPSGLLFMRIDASQAASAAGVPLRRVGMFFMQQLVPGLATIEVGAAATAGRFGGASIIVQLYR